MNQTPSLSRNIRAIAAGHVLLPARHVLLRRDVPLLRGTDVGRLAVSVHGRKRTEPSARMA